jgi:insertion element IS1 protein InsB
MPAAQPRTINKLARQSHHLERFNNTLRPRVSRVVREARSFSKPRANYIGATKLVICQQFPEDDKPH